METAHIGANNIEVMLGVSPEPRDYLNSFEHMLHRNDNRKSKKKGMLTICEDMKMKRKNYLFVCMFLCINTVFAKIQQVREQ